MNIDIVRHVKSFPVTEFSSLNDQTFVIERHHGIIKSKERKIGKRCFEFSHLSGRSYYMAGFHRGTHIYAMYSYGSHPSFNEYADSPYLSVGYEINIGVTPKYPMMICYDMFSSVLTLIVNNKTYRHDPVYKDDSSEMTVFLHQGSSGAVDTVSLKFKSNTFNNKMPK